MFQQQLLKVMGMVKWEEALAWQRAHVSEENLFRSGLGLQVSPIPTSALSPVVSEKPVTREIELLCL